MITIILLGTSFSLTLASSLGVINREVGAMPTLPNKRILVNGSPLSDSNLRGEMKVLAPGLGRYFLYQHLMGSREGDRKNQGRRLPPISYSPDEETERPIERPGRRLDEFTSLNSLLSRMTINIGTESTFIFDSSGVTSNLPSWLTPDWLGFAGYGILSDITVANLKLDGDNPLSIKVGSPPDSR